MLTPNARQVPEALQIEIVGALLMSDALLDCRYTTRFVPEFLTRVASR